MQLSGTLISKYQAEKRPPTGVLHFTVNETSYSLE